MTNDQFTEILKRRFIMSENTLTQKAKRYATEDRLYNFKAAGRITGTSPAKALEGMLAKHLVATLDIINDCVYGLEVERTRLDEHIGDCINYFILLEALVVESNLELRKKKDCKCTGSDAGSCQGQEEGEYVSILNPCEVGIMEE